MARHLLIYVVDVLWWICWFEGEITQIRYDAYCGHSFTALQIYYRNLFMVVIMGCFVFYVIVLLFNTYRLDRYGPDLVASQY